MQFQAVLMLKWVSLQYMILVLLYFYLYTKVQLLLLMSIYAFFWTMTEYLQLIWSVTFLSSQCKHNTSGGKNWWQLCTVLFFTANTDSTVVGRLLHLQLFGFVIWTLSLFAFCSAVQCLFWWYIFLPSQMYPSLLCGLFCYSPCNTCYLNVRGDI